MNLSKECKRAFRALSQKYNLKIIDGEKKHAYSTVYLTNKTVGLDITFENRDHAVFVELYRLINGEFPVYKSVGEYDRNDDGYDIFDLIDLRHPGLRFHIFIEKKGDSVGKILDNYAIAIDKCAGDILKGDFSVFPKLKEIVEKRRRELKA